MLDKLLEYDYDIIVFFNQLGAEHWDWFWLLVTSAKNWIWLFVLAAVIFIKKYQVQKGVLLIFIAALIQRYPSYRSMIIFDLLYEKVFRFYEDIL